jgi:hypothetical protein
MLDFILYTQPKDKQALFEKNEYTLRELRKAPGSSQIKGLDEVVRGGILKLIGEIGEYRYFRFTCSYIERHGPSLVEVKNRPLDFWQSREGVLVVSFGFPRIVARVGIALLSLAAFKDPMQITPFPISQPDFLTLKEKVKSLGGTITLIDIRKVSWGGGVLRHLTMKGKSLERVPGLEEVLEKVEKISSLGFMLKGLKSTERNISFRLTDWGGGQIFSPPDPQPHEKAEFFRFLEETLLMGNNF